MQITPYLTFDGDCAEAIQFYADLFGGRIEMKALTYGETPAAADVPPEWHDRIIHVRLAVGDAVLMASDATPDTYSRPAGIHVSIELDDLPRAERIWEALAQGGTVQMPFAKTFFAERFGMVVDRFRTPWMIACIVHEPATT